MEGITVILDQKYFKLAIVFYGYTKQWFPLLKNTTDWHFRWYQV